MVIIDIGMGSVLALGIETTYLPEMGCRTTSSITGELKGSINRVQNGGFCSMP